MTKVLCLPSRLISGLKGLTGLMFIVFIVSSCVDRQNGKDRVPFVTAPFEEKNPLIILRKPGTTPAQFNKWLDSIRSKFGDVEVFSVCKGCDSTLFSLTGTGAAAYISQQTASGGNGTKDAGGPSGGDGPVYYSANFSIRTEDSILNNSQGSKPQRPRNPTQRSVTVAVFDTGLDTTQIPGNLIYKNATESCLGAGSENGWNFAYNTPDFSDDHAYKHGTVVTGFIMDQVAKYGQNGVRILPVKIHSSTGKSNLFDVLCGFSYAANRGAEIINASFGFYAPRYLKGSNVLDSSAFLLRKYIEEYLVPKNILLVAAAGNISPGIENSLFNSYGPIARRNLDSVSFYPGSLARDLKNVICVTTVNTRTYATTQNFSKNVVDIGVYADDPGVFWFQNPIDPVRTVIGSSFAAPVTTGILCANYNLIEADIQSGLFTKNSLWTKLDGAFTPPTVVHNEVLEKEFIKSRAMIK